MLYKPLFIRDVYVKRNLVMAPMAGITDAPFRALAKDGGAGMVCTEMISAKALLYRDRKTLKMLRLSKAEQPVCVQLFGAEPAAIAEAARIVEAAGADVLDINFGCPVPKITRSGAGAKLLENERAMTAIMEAAVKAVTIPVTIKIRTGLTEKDNVAPRIVQLAQESGISAVTVHGRAAEHGHSGKPDLGAIKEAVVNAHIPVIGNGGITDEISAGHFLKETGCAGLMIGRGAIGNYSIFNRIEQYLDTGTVGREPSWEERIALLKKHALMSLGCYGEPYGFIHLRKIAPFYLKGLPNAAKIRSRFNTIIRFTELDELFKEIWQSPYFENETL